MLDCTQGYLPRQGKAASYKVPMLLKLFSNDLPCTHGEMLRCSGSQATCYACTLLTVWFCLSCAGQGLPAAREEMGTNGPQ